MVFEFKLPDVGEGIHEGEIVNWLVSDGDHVDADEDIVEVMTDKATVQISSPVAGTIDELVYDEGDVVNVGEVFCLIAPDDEPEAASDEHATADAPSTADPEPAPADTGTEEPVEATSGARSNGGSSSAVIRQRTPEGVLAPPSVRIEARKRGIDISQVEGSGPAGRVSMDDLEAHEPAATTQEQPTPSKPRGRGGVAETFDFQMPSVSREDAREVEPISAPAGSTRATAHRATTYQPHFTHAVTVRADGLQEALASTAERADDAGLEIAPVVAVVKALAQALGEHPRLNALVDEETDELVIVEPVNVAVAWPTPEGQMLRTVERADEKGLLEIARTLADGGDDAEPTVTVAALDDEDAFVSTPVLVHPQVTGVVVGSLDEAAVLDDGKTQAGYEMTLSFSFDHRWIDGYHGALLAEDVEQLLTSPESMLLG